MLAQPSAPVKKCVLGFYQKVGGFVARQSLVSAVRRAQTADVTSRMVRGINGWYREISCWPGLIHRPRCQHLPERSGSLILIEPLSGVSDDVLRPGRHHFAAMISAPPPTYEPSLDICRGSHIVPSGSGEPAARPLSVVLVCTGRARGEFRWKPHLSRRLTIAERPRCVCPTRYW